MDESKRKNIRHIVKGIALILCVLFFTMPLVKCSQDSSLTASGWEISTGTGDLFDSSSNSGFPMAFMLLVIPIILLIVAFISTTFAPLRNVSILGLLAQCLFMIVARIKLNNGELKGAFELTGYNWLVVFIWFGIIGLMLYCISQEKTKESDMKEENLQSQIQGD